MLGVVDGDAHDRLRHVSTKVRHHSASLRERLGTGDRKMSAASSAGGATDISDAQKQVRMTQLVLKCHSRQVGKGLTRVLGNLKMDQIFDQKKTFL
jgi:hypothetical protein